jgi:hypothetical protein
MDKTQVDPNLITEQAALIIAIRKVFPPLLFSRTLLEEVFLIVDNERGFDFGAPSENLVKERGCPLNPCETHDAHRWAAQVRLLPGMEQVHVVALENHPQARVPGGGSQSEVAVAEATAGGEHVVKAGAKPCFTFPR